jgi:hypothetical protein
MTNLATGRAAAVLLAAPLLLVVASGCGLTGTDSAGPTSSAAMTSAGPTSSETSPTPAATPNPETPGELRARVLRDGVPLTSGDVTLVVLALTPTAQDVTAQPDGSARWEPGADVPTATPDGAAADPPAALVAAPDPLALDLELDGTVVVRRDAAPVAGLSSTGSGRLRGDGDVLELHGDVGAGVWLAAGMVEDLDWGEREGGRSLAVTPSAWARAGGLAAGELVPDQVVAAEPEAGSPTMLDQLACHQLGAPDKATWNLEPWRPDVGQLDMIVARCNPTE